VTTQDAQALDAATLTTAASAIADALGFDGVPSPAGAWPDSVGEHLVARFTGPVGGALHVGVTGDVAAQLQADPATAPSLVGAVLVALGSPTDSVDVDAFVPTVDPVAGAVTIVGVDGMELTVGLVLDAPTGALADYEPTPMQANGPGPGIATVGSLSMLNDVDMEVTVELGRTKLPIRELLSLQPGMVVEIDRAAGAPIDVLVNGRLIATGEVVVIDEEFGVRITEIISAEQPA
jgi:flagellar motor switch protein FliN